MQNNSKYVIEKHRNLVEACALNDRNAQIEIYNLYYKAMYNTSLRIVNDSFFAEDIMQEAFLDAFSKIKTFEWRSSFGSWLKRIVINKSLDSIPYITKSRLISIANENRQSKIQLNLNRLYARPILKMVHNSPCAILVEM